MKKEEFPSKIIFALITIMILIKIFDAIFNPNKTFSGRTAAFLWIEIITVTILGLLGSFLYKKIKLPELNRINKKAILTSALYGIGFGILFVTYDSIAKIGYMSVGFPLSIIFYIWGAITSEVIFRLFAISLFVFLISNFLFKKKYNKQVYWTGAVILSLITAISMLMAFTNPEIPLNKPTPILYATLGILVFASEIFSFKLLKKNGFLSPLTFRLSFYLIWHIIWPPLFY